MRMLMTRTPDRSVLSCSFKRREYFPLSLTDKKMQFVPISFGDLNLIFPDSVSVTRDFTFSRPANTAQAVLQGFDLEYDDPDHHLRRIKVALRTHFHAG